MKINSSEFVSPNFKNREDVIDTIIIHSTHMPAIPALQRLCDKEAEVSCHYLIDLEGMIYQLVPEDKISFHAGSSCWKGRTHLNKYSIGIELVDRYDNGRNIEDFLQVQIDCLITLLQDIRTRYAVSDSHILAHSDIAPDRKDDPGEKFPWAVLAKNGIGIYPGQDVILDKDKFLIQFGDEGDDVMLVQKLLHKYGYKISVDSKFGQETKEVIMAFKRHFDPRKIDDIFDGVSLKILRNIIL